MTTTEASPISKLLETLGLTRDDLSVHSQQMRQFLTADTNLPQRVQERDAEFRARTGSDLRSISRSLGPSSSMSRSLSRASSSSLRDGTPPATPVKPEPHDAEIPQRRMDSMDVVLERQRRQRKKAKGREREAQKLAAHPPSPSPSNASQTLPSASTLTHSRDDSRSSEAGATESAHETAAETPNPPPITPQKNKYYRDHTNLSTDSATRKPPTCKTETATPTRPVAQQAAQALPQAQYYAYPGYLGYSHFMPVPLAYRPPQPSASSIPITPQPQRIQPSVLKKTSPLPASSPPRPSSPMSSSPSRGINTVSSPGPMGPAPEENEYDNLPYTLPPGPYSPNKPDLSYAALVGRAILSSPEHRLTLQEIYDWITIVYPHYKRGETTWMNSIRHVLSTTVCFRKVPRDRSVGRTLWAIYDEDLECFKDGGFKKQFCKDYINADKDKGVGGSKGKAKARKRGPDDDDTAEGRKPKKPRKEATFGSSFSSDPSTLQPAFMAAPAMPTISSHPMFPPTRPNTHHQPYYQTVQQSQGFAAEVIFPPLPPTAAFNRVVNNYAAQPTLTISANTVDDTITTEMQPPSPTGSSSPIPSLPSSSVSSSSIPDLTPDQNSSSPPSSLIATSDADIDMHSSSRPSSAASNLSQLSASVLVADTNSQETEDTSAASTDDDDSIFNTSLLGPVRFWTQASPHASVLQPSIELFDTMTGSPIDRKGKKKETTSKGYQFPPFPTSPTLNVRVKQTYVKSDDLLRPSSPTSLAPSSLGYFDPPSTPPRNTSHQISSIRTPLSHKGLHMSPTASLAHYKSNLDPPPAYSGGGGVQPLDLSQDATTGAALCDEDDPNRTPRKRLTNSSAGNVFFGHPVTPRKLTFPPDSPFRTPMAGSPFRTPGSRLASILDPHDPRTVLHEELDHRAYEDSPGGIFGKDKRALLYDSPGYGEAPKWW
ncbi:hypothetical protein BDN70DRAFT_795750 [Pholiota conissans]|uniref:Fork-head domain-containing protein n=1 Tax=Pholiota conissans TaxID=109636 RepID=A0A9P5ZDK5_9AGAR|nr:hypothetical protein BDN70DRAFT_795750 [Pholiota conissans]